MSRTGILWVLDTCVVGNDSSAMLHLWNWHRMGWVNLSRTDTVDTELMGAGDDKRRRLLERSAQLVEHLGPVVLGHSRLDHAVLGSAGDAHRLDAVFRILFPGADKVTARKNHLRDAMNVATAIRYGANGFITTDRRLLNKTRAVVTAFDGFQILAPEAALTVTERLVARRRLRTQAG